MQGYQNGDMGLLGVRRWLIGQGGAYAAFQDYYPEVPESRHVGTPVCLPEVMMT